MKRLLLAGPRIYGAFVGHGISVRLSAMALKLFLRNVENETQIPKEVKINVY